MTNLSRSYGGIALNLRPGTAWAIYQDNGPKGPCGQSVSITSPHTELHTWPDEASMRADLAVGIGRNKLKPIAYGVVDGWSVPGPMNIVQH